MIQDMKKKIIIVLGMHRSGTSAITRALQTMEVNLGDRLMPPVSGNNDKGFWEDIDFNALNIEILNVLGSDWHHVAPIAFSDQIRLRKQGYFLRAVELLRSKVFDVPVFGFKDPRVAKLLPFWKEVITHCQYEVCFVLSLRNPLSVVKSLSKRDNFYPEKSYLLWLEHVINSLSVTVGAKRVLVDYDLLMKFPDRELARIARGLNLDIDQAELDKYKSEFLDEKLRHTVYTPNNLDLDDSCPSIVREIYTALWEVASDLRPLDDAGLQRQVDEWVKEVERLNPLLALVDKCSSQEINLNQAVVERDGQIAGLNQSVVERDGQIAGLNQALVERDGQIAGLNQLVAERDGQIAVLNYAVSERNGQVANLNQLQVEEKVKLELQNNELQRVYSSRSWRLTRPLRGCARILRSLCKSGRQPVRFTINFIKTAQRELHRHGVVGFVRRVPYYLRRRRDLTMLIASRPAAIDGFWFDISSKAAPNNIRLHPELERDSIESIDHSVSIVIPTLNAGAEFRWLLRKLLAQQGISSLEIVIVDSGSTDGTVELARETGCTLVQITPQEFTHSHARNLGAEAASGDYLLIMVQDAYPIGDYWVYGILRYLLDHASQKLAGVSCAEYGRTDSDMMYDSMINTHYKFLGCLEYDRIGEFHGEDHMSLRSQGQLSDVACMINREFFGRYRYRGDYAEDLDLGIRLIKDGYRVAMMASVKVIHSHDRSSHYYFKRSFVDVLFLVDIFKDFAYPRITSVRGLLIGIVSVAMHLSEYFADFKEDASEAILHEDLSATIKGWRKTLEPLRTDSAIASGDEQLDAYVRSLSERYLDNTQAITAEDRQEARRFLDAFLARLEHFNSFVAEVYLQQDTLLRRELRDVIRKTFAAAAGSALGFMYMDYADDDSAVGEIVEQIKNELKAGV